MPIVLHRVDERLVHGQVVVGWGSRLRADRIVIVDDELAGSEWEQELYCLGLPIEMAAQFVTVADARAMLAEWRDTTDRIILLTRDVATMANLARDGLLRDAEVNIGGIHHAAGRRRVLPYVFLSRTETDALRELASEGVEVSARDLPGSRAVSLEQLIEDGSKP